MSGRSQRMEKLDELKDQGGKVSEWPSPNRPGKHQGEKKTEEELITKSQYRDVDGEEK